MNTDLDEIPELTQLGRELAERLQRVTGIDVFVVFGCDIEVQRDELFDWAGEDQLDQAVWSCIIQTISGMGVSRFKVKYLLPTADDSDDDDEAPDAKAA